MPERRLVPKPMPVAASRQGPGGRPGAASRWRRIAAPVGVTRSPSMPSSMTAKPCSSSAAAGAGTGRAPWLLAMRPRPTGSGAVDQLAPSASITKAAPTTSAIESQSASS